MKYYETTPAEYLRAASQFELHPELTYIVESMPKKLNELGNMILYGPAGVGKYTQFLRLVEKYSATNLKIEKMTAKTDKHSYIYHISDVHYEIDFAQLGCETKKMWTECFFQIIDVVSSKYNKNGIILCRNFHTIHCDLLEVFYSYIQHCRTLSIHLAFVLITEHISFIPNNILQCFRVIRVQRPKQELYRKFVDWRESTYGLKSLPASESGITSAKTHEVFLQNIFMTPTRETKRTPYRLSGGGGGGIGAISIASSSHQQTTLKKKSAAVMSTFFGTTLISTQPVGAEKTHNCKSDKIIDEIPPENILNLKELNLISMASNVADIPNDIFNVVCDNIIQEMLKYKNPEKLFGASSIRLLELREHLYDILLYGLDITDCIWYVLYYFAENNIMDIRDNKEELLTNIMDKTHTFLKYYNNNYRPIYHLESMFIYLITQLFGYPQNDAR